MVFFAVTPQLGTAQSFCDRLRERGVAALNMGPSRVRMVLHLDVSSADVDRAGVIIAEVAKVRA